MSSEKLGHLETEDDETQDPMALEMEDIRQRELVVLHQVEKRRLELTEALLNSNPTDEDRQKYITEIRKLEAIRMAHGSPAEKVKLFSLEVPDFAVKNKDEGTKEQPVAAVVEEGKQIIHRVLETIKGVKYKEKAASLDIWERNAKLKVRHSVQGSRHQRISVAAKLRKHKPNDARPKQNPAGEVGPSGRIAGQTVPETAEF